MSLDDKALITLDNFKSIIEESGSSLDTLFEMLINHVSALMLTKIGWNIIYDTYIDKYFDGNGERDFYLPERQIISIASLEEDEVALTEGEDEDFVISDDRDYLHRVDGVWSKGVRNLKITYSAGYKRRDIIYFDSGSEEPGIGDTLVGASSSAEGIVSRVVLESGTWGDGDAAGMIEFSSITGTFTDNENVNINEGSSNVMTVNHPDSTIWLPKDIQLACAMQVEYIRKKFKGKLFGETSRSYPDGSISYMTVSDLLPEVEKICERYQRYYI